MTYLILETSSDRGCIGFVRNQQLLFSESLPAGPQSSRQLFVIIQKGLHQVGLTLEELTAIGVGTGPGLFTGIRVGVAAAEGLGLALSIPVIGLPSLTGFISEEEGVFISVIDIGLGEVFFSIREYRESRYREIESGKQSSLKDFYAVAQNFPCIGPKLSRLEGIIKEEKSPNLLFLAQILEEKYQDQADRASSVILYPRATTY